MRLYGYSTEPVFEAGLRASGNTCWAVLAHGLGGALMGSLPIDTQFRARKCPPKV